MKRYMTSALAAFGCAAMLGINATAQTTESKTKIKTEHAKAVSYTGCVQTGTQTRTYVLQNVVPISTTQTAGTSGTVSTSTTYALVPESTIELQSHVGHKVQVEGVLIKAGKGDAKIESKTKKSGGAEERTKTEVERGPYPQLRVISVKPLTESCS